MLPEQTDTKLQIPEAERRQLVRLMRRVSPRSFLASLIVAPTGQILRPDEAASDMCTVLNVTPETKWRERLVATIALRYVPIAPTEESAAARALGKALQINPSRRIAATAILRATYYLMIAFLGFALSYVLVLAEPSVVLAIITFVVSLFFLVSSPFVFLCSLFFDTVKNWDVQLEAAETLARLQLPESVGALAKASRGKKRLSDITRNTLVQLLPTLTEAHYGRLPNDATPELCVLLFDKDTSERLITLTTKAIGKIGDGRAVEPMRKFAQSARTPKLRELAESILPVLLARRDQENASSTLLRHSSAPPVDAGQLLRATSAAPATPPELLLRPSAGLDAPTDKSLISYRCGHGKQIVLVVIKFGGVLQGMDGELAQAGVARFDSIVLRVCRLLHKRGFDFGIAKSVRNRNFKQSGGPNFCANMNHYHAIPPNAIGLTRLLLTLKAE